MVNTEIDDENYKIQVSWEQDGLTASSTPTGVRSFWLPKRNSDLPYTEGREYAKTSYKEFLMSLGVKLVENNINIVFGMDEDFENSHLYNRDRYVSTAMARLGIHIQPTLEATLDEALALLNVQTL
jgi:hypothetical protein